MEHTDRFGLVEVRIRYDSEGEARLLTYWRIGGLSVLRDLLSSADIDGNPRALTGQFVIDSAAAYYEIVVEAE